MVLVLQKNLNTSPTPTQTPAPVSSSSSYDADGDGDATETPRFSEDFDSTCSTPYVSAPSSPGRGPTSRYFFSAPASPMHFVLSSATCHLSSYDSSLMSPPSDASSSFEFEFSSRFSTTGSLPVGSDMSSADELFLNGQIRPMKLSSHLQRPQILAPLLDLDVEDEEAEYKNDDGSNHREASRGRDLKLRSRSLHRKARSLSPLRTADFQWEEEDGEEEKRNREEVQKDVSQRLLDGLNETATSNETMPSTSASSSRSSSSGRNSKKWIFLKDLLYRSKSEGRGSSGKEKFWTSISFSPSKEKKTNQEEKPAAPHSKEKHKQKVGKKVSSSGKPANGVAAKRRVPPSPHELHYTINRAQAEEMKKRTYLPYRQGLFGCLGFSSKGYGALNGLAKSLNPISSR